MNLRRIAGKILTSVLKNGLSLTVALENAGIEDLPAKDKAFVQALCFGCLRWFHQLDFLLQQLTAKAVKDEEIKALLLIGIYQLQFMRVKDHAAVSETVAALPKKKQYARGLLNGVLRNFIRQQDKLLAECGKHRNAQISHPHWMLKRIEENWPEYANTVFEENNRQPPMTLRVNQRLGSREDYLQLLQQQGLQAKACEFSRHALILQQATTVENLPGFTQGRVSVQDAAAQMTAGLLDVVEGQSILDVCAAPGGKTAHILEAVDNNAHVLAIDIDEQRLQKVQAALSRLQLCAETKVADASKPELWWDGKQFDRILLDAPCSASGVIRRHPDIKLLRRDSDIKPLQELQSDILHAVWPLLKKGGILLYATCSVFKEENEVQVGKFLAGQSDAEEVILTGNWGNARPHGRQILPGDAQMDGFYYAKLFKK